MAQGFNYISKPGLAGVLADIWSKQRALLSQARAPGLDFVAYSYRLPDYTGVRLEKKLEVLAQFLGRLV